MTAVSMSAMIVEIRRDVTKILKFSEEALIIRKTLKILFGLSFCMIINLRYET